MRVECFVLATPAGAGAGGRVDLWRFGAQLAALRRHQEEGRGLRHHQYTDEFFHRLKPREQLATLAAAEAGALEQAGGGGDGCGHDGEQGFGALPQRGDVVPRWRPADGPLERELIGVEGRSGTREDPCHAAQYAGAGQGVGLRGREIAGFATQGVEIVGVGCASACADSADKSGCGTSASPPASRSAPSVSPRRRGDPPSPPSVGQDHKPLSQRGSPPSAKPGEVAAKPTEGAGCAAAGWAPMR